MTQAQSPAADMRPRGVGELLDAAIKIYFRNAWTLFAAVLVPIVPLQILAVVVLASSTPDDAVTGGEVAVPLGANIVVNVLAFIASLLATAACFKAISDAYLGERPEWRTSLALAFRRLGPLLWLSVLETVLLVVAFVLLIIPGIWLGVAWSVAVPALVAEDIRGSNALRRSFRLVRHRWWSTFGALIVGFLIAFLVQLVIGFILGLVVGLAAGESVVAVVIGTGVAQVVAAMVTTPFIAAFVALIYFDLRTRKEGLDVELLVRTLGTPGAGRPAAPVPGAPAETAPAAQPGPATASEARPEASAPGVGGEPDLPPGGGEPPSTRPAT